MLYILNSMDSLVYYDLLYFSKYWNYINKRFSIYLGKSKILVNFLSILQEMLLSISLMVCLVFWTMLIWYLYKKLDIFGWVLNITIHGINCACLWFDFYNNYHKSSLKNIKFPLIFGSVYLLFNFIWTQITQRPIYPIVTYQNIYSYIFILFVYISIYFIHMKLLKKMSQNK